MSTLKLMPSAKALAALAILGLFLVPAVPARAADYGSPAWVVELEETSLTMCASLYPTGCYYPYGNAPADFTVSALQAEYGFLVTIYAGSAPDGYPVPSQGLTPSLFISAAPASGEEDALNSSLVFQQTSWSGYTQGVVYLPGPGVYDLVALNSIAAGPYIRHWSNQVTVTVLPAPASGGGT